MVVEEIVDYDGSHHNVLILDAVPTEVVDGLINECVDKIIKGNISEIEDILIYDYKLSDEIANYIFDEAKRRAIMLERGDQILQDAIATLKANGFQIVPTPALAKKIMEQTGKSFEELQNISFEIAK